MRGESKLRVLGLHGYHGTGDVLRDQMGTLVSDLADLVDFVFIDAPSWAAGDFGWWHAVDAEPDPACGTEGNPSHAEDPGVHGPRRHYKGWPRTRDAIVSLFRKEKFDGLFGFSQGAALSGLLTGMRAVGERTAERPLHFDFAIMVSGFPSNDPKLSSIYDRPDAYDLPALHVLGRADAIVPVERTRALAAHFKNPMFAEHGGGHVIPTDKSVRERIRVFTEERFRSRK
jgi:fermentation-respiration switch protein FrsA (DUF1100 family)